MTRYDQANRRSPKPMKRVATLITSAAASKNARSSMCSGPLSAAERMRAYRTRLKQSGAVRRPRPLTVKPLDPVDRQSVQDALSRAASFKAEYERLRAEYARLQTELKATSQLHWVVTKEIVLVQRALQAAQPARTARGAADVECSGPQ